MSLIQEAHLYIAEAVIAAVNVTPDPKGLPGGEAAQKLLNGGAAFGLLACAGAFLWGGAQWGFGKHSNNYAQAEDGKGRMLKAAAGAFAIGAAGAVINFFFKAGGGV
ncbi:MAG: hypothetical protein R2725_11775 [Solirubrobacterales bacterium]